MEKSSKMENISRIIASLVAVIGILVGVWQFNKGQKNLQQKELQQRKFEMEKMMMANQFQAIARFKEIQAETYKDATKTISNIIYADNYQSNEFENDLKEFWQLYWIELSAVEDQIVETAMIKLGDYIKELQKKNFQNISAFEKNELFNRGYEVA